MFEEIKNKVQNIINDSSIQEIRNYTNNKNIGIYMIYIDNFNDDRIIPIYIGQTGYGKNRNFQNRYKEHLQEIMALNRLRYNYYKEILLDNFYDGHYKACKIFQYMVDHNCTLKDFHMIVLEEIEENIDNIQEILDIEEQKYFAEYLPAFFGFNQINTVVEGAKEITNTIKSDKLLQYELEDCENFIKYFGYGYTKFNYYHCYPKTQNIDETNENLLMKLKKKLEKEHYDKNRFREYDVKLLELKEQVKIVTKKIEEYNIQFEHIYEPIIKEYCTENKISIVHKFKDIKNMLFYDIENEIDSFWKKFKSERIEEFRKYLKRKRINNNIIETFNNDEKFIKWKKGYLDLFKEKNKLEYDVYYCSNIRRVDDLMRILPQRKYEILPLKDRYEEITFNNIEDNSLIINLEFSNYGIFSINDLYAPCELIKIDYCLNIKNKIIEKKNIFIKSLNDNEFKKIDYYEKDLLDKFKFKKSPFSVTSFSIFISPSMEFQNGINEFTLINKEKHDFEKVLDEINLLINEDTKIDIKVRDKMKNKCKDFVEYNYKTDNLLKYKIIQFFNRKK